MLKKITTALSEARDDPWEQEETWQTLNDVTLFLMLEMLRVALMAMR